MFKLIVYAILMATIIFGQSAQADPPLPSVLSKQCTPTEAAVFFGSRFHIKCRKPMRVGIYRDVSIYYFSISTNDRDDVNNALELANTAIATGKRLRLWARTGSSQNPSGCQTANCRKLTGITLLK